MVTPIVKNLYPDGVDLLSFSELEIRRCLLVTFCNYKVVQDLFFDVDGLESKDNIGVDENVVGGE